MDQVMSTLKTTLSEQMGIYIPQLGKALAILIIGWIVAKILGSVVAGALKKTDWDNKLAAFLTEDGKEPINVEAAMGTATYYLVMVLVLIGVFDALKLQMLTQPLNEFSSQIAGYLPNLIAAVGLFVLASMLATVLKLIVTKGLDRLEFDKRTVIDEEAGELPLSKSLGEVAYWLVYLMVLPAILSALQLAGLLEPVQTMMDQFMAYIPNLVGAAAVLGVGWFAARILEKVVSNLLAAGGVDQFSQKIGLADALGDKKLSHFIGLLVYVLVLLPAVVGALDALQMEAVTEPVKELLATVVNTIPLLIGAGVILLLAHLIGKVASDLLASLCAGAGFDKVPGLLGVQTREGNEGKTCSEWIGTLIYALIMVMATIEAANMLRFEYLSDLVGQFLIFALQIFTGVIIFGIGLYLSNLASNTVASSSARFAPALAATTRVAILFLAGAMALRQMGLANEIIELAFGLLLGAVAVAIALAFGLGARDIAAKEVESWLEDVRGGKSPRPKKK